MITGKLVLSNDLTNPTYAYKSNFLVVLQRDQKFKIIHKSKIKPHEQNRLLSVFFECDTRHPIGLKLQPKYFALVDFLMQNKTIPASIHEVDLQHDFLAIENITTYNLVIRRLKDLESKWNDYPLFQKNKSDQYKIISVTEEHSKRQFLNTGTVYIPNEVADIVLDIDLLLNTVGFTCSTTKIKNLIGDYPKEVLLYAEQNQKRLNLNKREWEHVIKWFKNN